MFRSLRSLLPFLLASFGFTMIAWAAKMPLFEWQFSEIVTDFSSACNGTLPSRWTTRFGEDLEARDRPSVLENLNIVVKRSWNDETLDRMSLDLYRGSQLLFIEVILSIGYIWWFLLQDRQDRAYHLVMAVFSTAIAVFMCLLLTQVVRLAGPAVGHVPYYSEIRHCHGAITFDARLSRIYYETLTVLLASVLSAVGALVVMVYQMRIAIMNVKSYDERNNPGQIRKL